MAAKTIQHVVMLCLLDDFDTVELQDIMSGFDALRGDTDGFLNFQYGPNRDFEQKSQDYSYGFVCHFADRVALQTYANDPIHQRLGARLVAMCEGGVAGIWVADIEVT